MIMMVTGKRMMMMVVLMIRETMMMFVITMPFCCRFCRARCCSCWHDDGY